MKWMASGSVKLFGTTYSAGQSVDTTSWTPTQLQQQIYLGNIVLDTRIGYVTRFDADGGSWGSTYADFTRFSFTARGSFVGPESGRMLLHTYAIAVSYTHLTLPTNREV